MGIRVFYFTASHSLGFGHSGEVMVYGQGQVKLTDEEVEQLVSLVRENGGNGDVKAIHLEEKHPDIYRKLDDACQEIAREAEYRHWIIEGYENRYYEKDLDELIEQSEEQYGYHFEYNPKDFIPEEDLEDAEEDGDYEEWVDEDALYEAKSKAFHEWVDDHRKTLDSKAEVSFLAELFELDPDIRDFDYDVLIPEDIVKMAQS